MVVNFFEILLRDYTTIVSGQFLQISTSNFAYAMSEQSAVENNIKHCIDKNGFPGKSVRLPFKAIHESCKKYDSALKEVLANLAQEKIIGTVQGDFIEFRSSDKLSREQKTSNKANDSSQPNLPNMGHLKEMAQSYMSKMSSHQIKELEKTVENMSEEEKEKILKSFSEQFFKGKP